MNVRTIGLALLAGAAGTAVSFGYESLADLQEDMLKRQGKALEEYVAGHPGAADAGDARLQLIAILTSTGREAEALPLLQEEYRRAVSAAKIDVRTLYMGVLQPMVKAYAATGKKAEARAALKKAEEDTAKAEDAQRFAAALKELAKELDQPGVGDKMDLSFKALDGAEVNLAAMTNRVVLVDFWATWCGPCKNELPAVKEAFEKFHAQGFEIIGISLDEDKTKLEAFLKENGMTWPQYFDGKGRQNEQAAKFAIRSIPATFLVGKDGTIAAKDLRGSRLNAKIAELLGPAKQ